MNFYIDFDHTLYNTPLLTNNLLNAISNFVSLECDLENTIIYNECKEKFNRKNIYNIYELANFFCKKYSLDYNTLRNKLDIVIANCQDFIFDDSVSFLKKLKQNNHTLYMLSYCEYGLEFQTAKIAGSKLTDFFDSIIVTSKHKFKLDINYSEGIFIDDKPSDLLGLLNNGAKKVIRIRRENDTYSNQELDSEKIKEYSTLLDIPIN